MIYKKIILLLKLFVLSIFSLNSDYSFWKSSVEMGWTKLFNLLEGTWLLVKMTKIHLNCMLSFFCTRTFFITINTILRFFINIWQAFNNFFLSDLDIFFVDITISNFKLESIQFFITVNLHILSHSIS